MVASSLAIDVDEIYREMDGRNNEHRRRDSEQPGFQFQVKHLLVLTAVVAVLLTIMRFEGFGKVAALAALALASGTLGYFDWREQQRWIAAQRRFQEKYERRRRFFEERARVAAASPSNKEEVTIYDDLSYGSAPGYPDWAADAPAARIQFRFQFSVQQMLIATTVAAVMLMVIQWLGGPQNAASLLGMIALGGLLAHALGFDPPEMVILGWWMVLFLYILLSIGVAISSAFA
jgi:hypothetical protein